MSLTLEQCLTLLETQGAQQYGLEAVTQREHALQCAFLAEQAGAPEFLIAACLLHDLGHLLHDWGEQAAADGLDDRHEVRAAVALQDSVAAAVVEPIRLHVAAKRYLCAVDEQYAAGLSAASQRSLQLQGNPYSTAEAAAFLQRPYAQAAIQLRRWDDQAKEPGRLTPNLTHFRPYLAGYWQF